MQTDTIHEHQAETVAGAAVNGSQIHLARCATCGNSVRFKPLASGFGFSLPDPVDATYGVGPEGRPECPNGHGEMAIADDQMPADDAIDQVREQLAGGPMEPLQGTLPGIVPAFNYQGAYLDLEQKAVEVDRLKSEWETDKEAAAASKKAWEKAAELYTKMALEFQRRRREKVDTGSAIADLDTSRCAWEQAHPDAHCPQCTDEKNQAPEHVAEIEAWLLGESVDSVVDALDSQAMWVKPEVIREWTQEQRDEIEAWAKAAVEGADPMPARPAVLGTMHVAGAVTDDEPQTCTQCDLIINSGIDNFPAGTLVGIDCKGKPKEAHRYPKPRKAKKGKK